MKIISHKTIRFVSVAIDVLCTLIVVASVVAFLSGCDECSGGESKCVKDKVFECADGQWQESLDCSELLDSWTCCEDTAGEADCGECE